MKKNYADIFKKFIESNNYELLSEYKNAKTKVKLKCPEGHIYNVKPNTFKNGRRCPICSNKCPIQAKEQFLELLEKVGYELLSEYKTNRIKVKLKCPKGHLWRVAPNSVKRGIRCSKCAGNSSIQAKEQFTKVLQQEGYILLSEYKSALKKVKLKCPEGHLWETIPSSFKNQYCRCPHCAGSTGQRLLQEMLESYNLGKVIYNDREVLGGLELDIYYPGLKIGIEYQGNYWHSLPKHIERDKKKRKLCKENNINLIEIWDNDFMASPDKITKQIYREIKTISLK